MAVWESQVVDRLASLRSAGHTFEGAWGLALRGNPPKGQVAGIATPRLFEDDGRAPETLVEFFKRACRDAYEGRVDPPSEDLPEGDPRRGNGPGLRYFNVEMLRDLDSSAPASGRIRQAA
jgi:hypothetical protein